MTSPSPADDGDLLSKGNPMTGEFRSSYETIGVSCEYHERELAVRKASTSRTTRTLQCSTCVKRLIDHH
jgi:hypothetical protein